MCPVSCSVVERKVKRDNVPVPPRQMGSLSVIQVELSDLLCSLRRPSLVRKQPLGQKT